MSDVEYLSIKSYNHTVFSCYIPIVIHSTHTHSLSFVVHLPILIRRELTKFSSDIYRKLTNHWCSCSYDVFFVSVWTYNVIVWKGLLCFAHPTLIMTVNEPSTSSSISRFFRRYLWHFEYQSVPNYLEIHRTHRKFSSMNKSNEKALDCVYPCNSIDRDSATNRHRTHLYE
jgi:hypothetical protein